MTVEIAARADPSTLLQVLDQTLRLEAHNLARSPELIWQQCYNELQWEDPSVPRALDQQFARRQTPWLHRRNRFRQARALLQVLESHTDSVKTCAVSPDGSFIVSGSSDATLKIWDAESGRLRTTLRGHERSQGEGVQHCAISSDGSFIVSAGADAPVRMGGTRTGEGRVT